MVKTPLKNKNPELNREERGMMANGLRLLQDPPLVFTRHFTRSFRGGSLRE